MMKLVLALSVTCVATTHALPAFNATAAVPYGAQRTLIWVESGGGRGGEGGGRKGELT